MTCQLLLNYVHHLDQSARCQRRLILFIVAATTVPADTERHRARDCGRGSETAVRDGIAGARVDGIKTARLLISTADNQITGIWRVMEIFPESGNGFRQQH